MGFADCCPFLHELDTHRELVAQEFDTPAGRRRGECKACSGPKAAQARGARPGRRCWSSCRPAARAHRRCGSDIRACWRCATTPAPGCRALVARTAQWLERGPGERRRRRCAWPTGSSRCCAAKATWRLLVERPGVHERLLRLLGAARWPARYLLQHPGVIDELASDEMLSERFIAAGVRARAGASAPLAADHRRGRRRSAAQPAAPRPPCRSVPHAGARRRRPAHGGAGGRRTERAGRRGAARDGALVLAAPEASRHRETPQFAIIGYGKLGGKELGYGSDLDIVFVYEDEDERAPRGLCRLRAQADQLADHQDAPRATCSRSTRHCAPTAARDC